MRRLIFSRSCEDWHEWLKMLVACGVRTHVVTGVELTSARTHDAPYFKPLLEQTAKAGFKMQEVSADKGYTSAETIYKRRVTSARRLSFHSKQT